VASGIAVSSPAAFAAELRRAGDLLARSGTGDEEALATELDAVTAAIQTIQPGAAPRPAPGPARPAPAATVARPPAAAPAVPVPRAAPGPAPAPTPVAAPRAEPAVPETPDLVGSWAAYQRLADGGIGPASLAQLVGGGAAPAVPTEAAAVDVRALLYRGDRALRRAQELRAAAKQASGDTLRELVDEVCDLVALALEPNP